MKKWFLFLSILKSAILFSQTFNYADHEGNEITFGSVSINSKSFYVIVSNKISNCCSDEAWLVARNDLGIELWRKQITTEPWLTRCRLAVCADKTILVYAGTDMRGCDY